MLSARDISTFPTNAVTIPIRDDHSCICPPLWPPVFESDPDVDEGKCRDDEEADASAVGVGAKEVTRTVSRPAAKGSS
jgi:hypothetical protein